MRHAIGSNDAVELLLSLLLHVRVGNEELPDRFYDCDCFPGSRSVGLIKLS